MNLLESITRQATGPLLGPLSTFLGTNEAGARSAVTAAAPALTSAISGLASNGASARKLIQAIGRFEPGGVERQLAERPAAMAEQGSLLADSLLGGGAVRGLSDSISRASGIGLGGASKLIGFLMPLILGGLAKKFAGRPLTPGSIGAALSGREEMEAASPYRSTYQPQARSTGRWVVTALVAMAGLGLFWAVSRGRVRSPEARPEAVDAAALTRDADGAISSLTATLADVKDEESARSAIPAIESLTRKVDGLRAQAGRLPEAARERFHEAIGPNLSELEAQTARLETVPGAEGIAPMLKDLVSDLRGAPPADVR